MGAEQVGGKLHAVCARASSAILLIPSTFFSFPFSSLPLTDLRRRFRAPASDSDAL